jgi:hypothetical protein
MPADCREQAFRSVARRTERHIEPGLSDFGWSEVLLATDSIFFGCTDKRSRPWSAESFLKSNILTRLAVSLVVRQMVDEMQGWSSWGDMPILRRPCPARPTVAEPSFATCGVRGAVGCRIEHGRRGDHSEITIARKAQRPASGFGRRCTGSVWTPCFARTSYSLSVPTSSAARCPKQLCSGIEARGAMSFNTTSGGCPLEP